MRFEKDEAPDTWLPGASAVMLVQSLVAPEYSTLEAYAGYHGDIGPGSKSPYFGLGPSYQSLYVSRGFNLL
jgi:hypothetical protein